jgi:3-phosphoglycerate kinase
VSDFHTLDDLESVIGDIAGKVALLRVDLNVPMADGRGARGRPRAA